MDRPTLSAAGVATEPCRLTGTEASRAIHAGRLGCEEFLRSCLARIEMRETEVRAWLHIDPELER
jgi:Asp-tRNA(Asn)/Glu-tRNA(Gln) amidotransferase A subunit family amidase